MAPATGGKLQKMGASSKLLSTSKTIQSMTASITRRGIQETATQTATASRFSAKTPNHAHNRDRQVEVTQIAKSAM
eukprot:5258855-Amphidinium_carterae.1